jgi:Uma2 family endonuclease
MTSRPEEWTMSTMTVMPREASEWTVHDLDLLPDDGLRYELLDGMLLVSPAPSSLHQWTIGRLFLLLNAGCPDDLKVFFAPLDWQPEPLTSLQPDLLVVDAQDVGVRNITRPLVVAVEVLSPSTRRKDLFLKRSKYQDAGVRSYWIVDPDAPSITVLELVDGQYSTVGEATGDQDLTLDNPFPITIVPSTLVA